MKHHYLVSSLQEVLKNMYIFDFSIRASRGGKYKKLAASLSLQYNFWIWFVKGDSTTENAVISSL